MKRKRINIYLAFALAACAITAVAGIALAQTSANYNLEWHVIGGGGQPVSSASYVVNSTIGQAVASPAYTASLHYRVSGGYWIPADYGIYLPVVVKG
jgi:hypothetical protein